MSKETFAQSGTADYNANGDITAFQYSQTYLPSEDNLCGYEDYDEEDIPKQEEQIYLKTNC